MGARQRMQQRLDTRPHPTLPFPGQQASHLFLPQALETAGKLAFTDLPATHRSLLASTPHCPKFCPCACAPVQPWGERGGGQFLQC